MKLVVINKLSPPASPRWKSGPGTAVEAYASVKEALPHLADADAVAMWGFHDAEPVLLAAPRLRWVHSLSDGVENFSHRP